MTRYPIPAIILVVLSAMNPLLAFSFTGDEKYQSGYSQGCYDAHNNSRLHSRMSEWAIGHSTIYMSGYYEGYRDCHYGTENWSNLCNQIQWALTKGCGVYVTPDDILTTEGVRAKNCILNGAIAYGAGVITGKNSSEIIQILKPFSEAANCGNIVDWDLLQTSSADRAVDFLKVVGVS